VPQAPQLVALVWMFTHVPPHIVVPVGQTQAPAEHTRPRGQALPQAPQWAAVFARFDSQPLVLLPSQLPKPALQADTMQVPAEQEGVAFAREHWRPQAPQCWVFVCVFTQAPPHMAEGAMQGSSMGRQAPAEHRSFIAHARPQAPQWRMSV
jgi:hypothetical protein